MDGSLGGVRYRAPYNANNKVILIFVSEKNFISVKFELNIVSLFVEEMKKVLPGVDCLLIT